jgi:hypothetical protein
MMDWFSAPDYRLARFVIERGLAAIYLLAFACVLEQFPALLGERGLLPVPRFLRGLRFRDEPTLFRLYYSDNLLRATGWAGVLVAGALVLGFPQAGPLWLPVLAWLILWLLYLSIVNVGQRFYSFGWESLLLEAGFIAIFLGNASTAPPFLVLLLFRWLVFRVELGAGLIKLRGDSCWRDLTCMDFHHETQPMPGPLSWYFHRLPRPLHRIEVLGNYVAQLVAPFMLFLPQPIAAVGALLMIGTQLYLMVSGNYAWLNALALVIAFAALPDAWIGRLLPAGAPAAPLAPTPFWFVVVVLLFAGVVAVLSYWPVRNLIGPGQRMNYSFNRLHLVNTYGAFGSVTRERHEVVLEGTQSERLTDSAVWREYEFRGKPGNPGRRPRQFAPYHLRLDWLMWFAALSPRYAEDWLLPLVHKLLRNDPATTRLLRDVPFHDAPPRWIRGQLYHYRFTTPAERRAGGGWWVRELVANYLPPLTLPQGASRGRGGGGRAAS